MFISVWVGEIHHYSRSGRVIVTFDLVSHSLSCQCSHSTKKGCLHKNIAKWHIYQNNPSIYHKSGIIDDGSLCIISLNELKFEESNLDFNKMTDYITEYKMLPLEIPIEFLKESFNSDIVLRPSEEECIYCKTVLFEQISTEKGVLITRFGISKNIKVWKKLCNNCNIEYWHNEIQSGIFNFDNHLFVSLDFLDWLRNAVQEHTAISREISMLEKRYKVTIEKDKVIKAFFKFISLTDINNFFKCCLCGYHPTILTFDVIRKCVFNMSHALKAMMVLI